VVKVVKKILIIIAGMIDSGEELTADEKRQALQFDR